MRMMTLFGWVLGLSALCFLSELTAGGCAKCRLQAAWGLAAQPPEVFDSGTVARFEGQVLSVQEVEADRDVTEGLYLLLKTQEGNMAVRVGPTWYVKRQGFEVQPYDKVEVLASKIEFDDKTALVATKIKNGTHTIALRNHSGRALWSKK